ncbi:unnamed protein product [Vitrella brassicaformis CCMP3155]|uniref:Uncharacterized protein n=4 Tax=Vitrella brassicaformis TaxID=1169539 RepID=A0A0G4EP34_VITBC|nr:unnamed protein product [Vitrella brassicaformis CCMP3155]|eukprot:CEL99570.1 unnamed protein product [Vitrella brassicaformis CCMP3155]
MEILLPVRGRGYRGSVPASRRHRHSLLPLLSSAAKGSEGAEEGSSEAGGSSSEPAPSPSSSGDKTAANAQQQQPPSPAAAAAAAAAEASAKPPSPSPPPPAPSPAPSPINSWAKPLRRVFQMERRNDEAFAFDPEYLSPDDPTVFTRDTTEEMRSKLYAVSALGTGAGMLIALASGGDMPLLAFSTGALATIEATRNTAAGGKLREVAGAVMDMLTSTKKFGEEQGINQALASATKTTLDKIDEFFDKNDVNTTRAKELLNQTDNLQTFLLNPTNQMFTTLAEAATQRVQPTNLNRYYRSSLPPFYERETILRSIGDGLYFLEQPLLAAGVNAGLRSVVVRLEGSGDLLVINPVAPTRECMRLLNSLGGKVAGIVVANTAPEHQIYVKTFADRYPDAPVYAARPPDQDNTYRINEILSDEVPSTWRRTLEQAVLDGGSTYREVVFFHKRSKSLIVTDFCATINEDFISQQPFLDKLATRTVARAIGIYERVGLLVEGVLNRYRARNQVFLQRVCSWEVTCIVASHGSSPIEGGPVWETLLGLFRRLQDTTGIDEEAQNATTVAVAAEKPPTAPATPAPAAKAPPAAPSIVPQAAPLPQPQMRPSLPEREAVLQSIEARKQELETKIMTATTTPSTPAKQTYRLPPPSPSPSLSSAASVAPSGDLALEKAKRRIEAELNTSLKEVEERGTVVESSLKQAIQALEASRKANEMKISQSLRATQTFKEVQRINTMREAELKSQMTALQSAKQQQEESLKAELVEFRETSAAKEADLRQSLSALETEKTERERKLTGQLQEIQRVSVEREADLRKKLANIEDEKQKKEEEFATYLKSFQEASSAREESLQKALQDLESSKSRNEERLSSSLRQLEASSSKREDVLKTQLRAMEADKQRKEEELLSFLNQYREQASESETNLRLALQELETSKRETEMRLTENLREAEIMSAQREAELTQQLQSLKAEKQQKEEELLAFLASYEERSASEAELRKALENLEASKKENEERLTRSLMDLEQASAEREARLRTQLQSVEVEKQKKEDELLEYLRTFEERSTTSEVSLQSALKELEASKMESEETLMRSIADLREESALKELSLRQQLEQLEGAKRQKEEELEMSLKLLEQTKAENEAILLQALEALEASQRENELTRNLQELEQQSTQWETDIRNELGGVTALNAFDASESDGQHTKIVFPNNATLNAADQHQHSDRADKVLPAAPQKQREKEPAPAPAPAPRLNGYAGSPQQLQHKQQQEKKHMAAEEPPLSPPPPPRPPPPPPAAAGGSSLKQDQPGKKS